MIEAIAFDLGGVVLRSSYDRPFLRNAGRKLGVSAKMLEAVIRREEGPLQRGEEDSLRFWRRVCESMNVPIPAAAILRSLWLYQYEKNTRIDPAMKRLVLSLRKTYPVIAISNTIPEHTRVNRKRGLLNLFDCALLSYEIGMRKPETRIFRAAAKILKIPPKRILFIDDDPKFVRGARAVGFRAVQFTSVSQLKTALGKHNILVDPVGIR